MHIVVTWRDHSLQRFAAKMQALGNGSARATIAEALNEGGRGVRAQTVVAETAQTGLAGGTIDRAQHEIDASAATLTFTIRSQGGNVRLKFFHPKEGGGGVTASPWNSSHFYARDFLTSGRPGNRRPSPKLHGNVMKPLGRKWGGPIKVDRSGLYIPREMTTGSTASAFEAGAHGVLATTVISRLGSLLGV